MDIVKGFGAAAIMFALSSPAMAFQETPVAPAATDEAAIVSGGGKDAAQAPKVELITPDINDAGNSVGTEIRIPGLGSLGMLPKLDFGLELLYGAAEDKRIDEEPLGDGITIRGTLKHKF